MGYMFSYEILNGLHAILSYLGKKLTDKRAIHEVTKSSVGILALSIDFVYCEGKYHLMMGHDVA